MDLYALNRKLPVVFCSESTGTYTIVDNPPVLETHQRMRTPLLVPATTTTKKNEINTIYSKNDNN